MKVTKTAKGNFQISGIAPSEYDAIKAGLESAKQRYMDAGLPCQAIISLIEAMEPENIESSAKGAKKSGKPVEPVQPELVETNSKGAKK